jgi:anaerobic selenocysteine-containing dehydrogenase
LRDDAEVLAGIATRLVGRRGLSGSLVGKLLRGIGHRVHPRELIRWAVRFGPYGNGLRPWKKGLTLDEIERHEHGIDLGELRPRIPGLLGRRRIQIAPAPMVSDLTRLEARLTSAITVGREDPDALLLVGRRHLRSNNSWMHNSLRLVRGKNRCTLLVHPVDAEARSLSNGDCARVRSRVGAIEAEVEVSDEMMAGVVSLPHGWGHGRRGAKLGVADSHAGVSVNDVTDETVVDPVSGCASLTAVRVTVERVARDVAFSSRTADA